ncbi:hypothetical protein K3722_07605 [Leisingera caerulea]|uniref:Uncharacterized protein n=1 Tax=Leisingera caerulea TaxID=506591 RepID=A0ABY5X068_LEICA|nr:hypothetical protein [Leisingera caerulea]UWQ59987.1 hypothetical protein K3722_07605 [Leisingera caerulea]
MNGELYPDQARMIGLILMEISASGVKRRKLFFEDMNEPEEFRALFVDCVKWLAAEEIIGTEREGTQGRFTGCCLRSKGFAMLGRRIEFGDQRLTISEATEQVSSGKFDASRAGDFLGGFFGGTIKSLGG